VTQALLLVFLIWAVLLVPLGVRRRQEHPQRTVNGFERAMDVLANDQDNTAPQGQHVARRVNALQQRRFKIFSAAVRTVGVAALAALIFGGWTWLVLVATVVLTGAYATVLRQAKQQRDHAELVVRELRTGQLGQDGAVPVKRSAHESRTVRLRSYGAK